MTNKKNSKNFCKHKIGFLLFFYFIFIDVPCLSAQSSIFHSNHHFSFILPSGWEKIPEHIVKDKLGTLYEKLGLDKPTHELVFKPKNAYPFEPPFFIISVFEQVHSNSITDSEIEEYKISIKSSIQQLFKRKEIQDIIPDSFMTALFFNKKKNTLSFSTESKIINKEGQKSLLYTTTIFFYKEGNVSLTFYSYKDAINNYLSTFKKIEGSFAFDKGYEFTQSHGYESIYRTIILSIDKIDQIYKTIALSILAIFLPILGNYIYERRRRKQL